ncbi:MAG TPA: NAD(P)-dependent oxidoreductase [Acidimicrobiia bacterium]|nr:NAD(P)-dependent oxidoreductase [Acidimicrobiia bacterium]
MISGEKILITGVSGTVAEPLARFLAHENEVWGVSRFVDDAGRTKEQFTSAAGPPVRDISPRESLEAAGITTHALDLGAGDFSGLPDDFTYVLHLAWMRADLAHLEDAMRTNVEGAGLLLQHCRRAKAALVMSGMGIYSASDDPWHAYTETDPIGRGATAYAPTSPASKLGVEAVARFCARAFDLPVVITRLNTFMGTPGSFPGMHIKAVLAGQPMVAPCDPNPHSPIHADDMQWQLEPLLDAASTTATITNWCGDDAVTAQDWVRVASELSGKEGAIAVQEAPGSPAGTLADPTRRQSITGPCRTSFADAFRRLYDTIASGEGTA